MKICQPGAEPRAANALVDAARKRLGALGASAGKRVLVADRHGEHLVATLIALVLQDCSIVLVDDMVDPAGLQHIFEVSRPDMVLGNLPHGVGCADDQAPSEWVLSEQCAVPSAPALDCELEATPWYDREDALVLFTSGSSGRPKAVVRSGAAIVENIRATGQAMRYRQSDVFLPLVPASHQYGFSMVLLAWMYGATFVVGNPARAVESLHRAATTTQPATIVDAAPAHYAALLQERASNADFASEVRLWCVGGAPCSEHLKRSVQLAFGTPLLDGYGMTELGNIALATVENPAGVGRVIQGVQIKILDQNAPGQPCKPGQPGRVWVRSTHTFSRYLHEDLVRGPADWFDTGDLGYLTSEGNLHVIGRDGAVHRKGHTLHLAGLEGQLATAGLEVVLIPVSTQQAETYLLAFARGDDPKSVKRRIRQSLPQHAWPNRTVVLPQFDMLPNGKIDRNSLAEQAHRYLPTQRRYLAA